jgi:hypothetical protein
MIDANGRDRNFKVSCHAKVPINIGTRGNRGAIDYWGGKGILSDIEILDQLYEWKTVQ